MTTQPARTRLGLPLVLAAWGSLAGLACDGIGEPLVDELPPASGVNAIGCRFPPACKPLEILGDWVAPEGDAQPVDRTHCAGGKPGSGAAPGPPPVGPRELNADAAVPLDEPDGGGRADAPDEPPLRDALATKLACESLNLAATDQPTVVLEGADWDSSNVRIAASRPLRVELRAAELQSVYFDLRGPVTLRLDGGEATDVRVVGRRTGDQAGPRLELASVTARAARVGAAGEAFSGTVVVTESWLETAVLHASDATISSSTVLESQLDITRLSVTDSGLEQVKISTDSALLSASKLARSRMHHCGDATLIAGRVIDSELRSCEAALLRAYGTRLVSSFVGGRIVSDTSNLEGVRVGVEQATDLTMFESTMSGAILCSNVERLTLGARSSVRCTGCSDRVVDDELVCRLSELEIDANYCTSLTSDPPLPECGEPIPQRTRMFEGVF